jgi:agmatinase
MSSIKESKADKIASFNANYVGHTDANIFGLPFTTEEADVVIIPVPWDVTVSNHDGTSLGPRNIFDQSPQIDLYDEKVDAPWKAGIAMEVIPDEIVKKNHNLREKARLYIQTLEENPGQEQTPEMVQIRDEINVACNNLNNQIKEKVSGYLKKGKLVSLIGGDHSTPLGAIEALAEQNQDFGVLQIDAHADLHPAFMGFKYSHASVIYNASRLIPIKSFVQVGLRDICEEEALFIKQNQGRFHGFYAREIHEKLFEGQTWKSICHEIIDKLPHKVYITFDIDGLDPAQCPGTGTPVPGGLSYNQILYMFEQLVKAGKTIIGFDLVETGLQPIDGIIACRILYKTIALMLLSNNRL